MATVSTAVLLEKLISIEASNNRMESKLASLDCKIQELEKDKAKKDSMANIIDDHEKRLRELEKLAPAMKVVIWVAGTLGVSVIALVWALITGQALIAFK